MSNAKISRIWFWKPQWHWFGWRTLVPFMYGHDQYARRTILFGWTVTGRIIIALWDCGNEECEQDATRGRQIALRAWRAYRGSNV